MITDIPSLERMLDPLSRSLNAAAAHALVDLKADEQLADELDRLAAKESADNITEEERRRYETYVSAASILSVLQAKARLFLRDQASA
ncbi:MAG: hypothetical protein K9N47_09005 [Prosthecobacter sp.]|uniref:hypothetical protein n=1 Tax=Prosthecobacter sp. TaxID=1965333 RepID=UPI0025E37489|nr:hypothetical protein [Prosthecobacter sp.]MCF7786249.1 hypothetical protein [Prosthecobacter sp.]